jgi:hypothetical protein
MSSSAVWAAQLAATPMHPTDRTYPTPGPHGGEPPMPLTDRQREAQAAVAAFDDQPPDRMLTRTQAADLHAARLEQSAANVEAAQQWRARQ